MRHDLTAVFNNLAAARHVLDELLLSGFPRARTLLVSPPEPGDTGRPPDAGPGSMLRRILARLFGPWHDEPERVDESAFLPGRHVITLTRAAELDAIRAIGIMERFDPVYIEDRRRQTGRVHKRNTSYAGPSG